MEKNLAIPRKLKMWHIYTMEYFAGKKKEEKKENELLIRMIIWINAKITYAKGK